MGSAVRHRIGAMLFDRPRLAWPLWCPRLAAKLGASWADFHNRGERLSRSPVDRGYDCGWRWTSDLTLARIFPHLGQAIMRWAFDEWPIGVDYSSVASGMDPIVSFVVGHRGAEKLPHLLATLTAIGAQEDCRCECIVVEQSVDATLHDRLPNGVRYMHTPIASDQLPYSRSWAFNVGARHARGDVLILHDNDLLVPRRYAFEAARVLCTQYEVACLGRFVFYLSQIDSQRLIAREIELTQCIPIAVTQNFQGGSLAIRRSVFNELGGFDEAFVGWGGEDNEMHDRCRTRRYSHYGYLPFLHLWHPPQPTKQSKADTSEYLNRRLAVSASERIAELSRLNWGAADRGCSSLPAGR